MLLNEKTKHINMYNYIITVYNIYIYSTNPKKNSCTNQWQVACTWPMVFPWRRKSRAAWAWRGQRSMVTTVAPASAKQRAEYLSAKDI
jgi:hypothetical protein